MIVGAEKLRAFHADGPITKRRAFSGAGNDTDVVGHDLILQRRHDLTDSCCGFAKLTALPVLQRQNPFSVINDVVGKLTRWIRFLEKAEGGPIWEGTPELVKSRIISSRFTMFSAVHCASRF